MPKRGLREVAIYNAGQTLVCLEQHHDAFQETLLFFLQHLLHFPPIETSCSEKLPVPMLAHPCDNQRGFNPV